MTALWNENNGLHLTNNFVIGSPIVLYQFQGLAQVMTGRYLHVFDAAAKPDDGAVPDISIPLSDGGDFSMAFGANGRTFANGIVFAISKTALSLTYDSDGQMQVDAQCYSS